MAVVTLPFFTVFWVAVATAIGLSMLVWFFKALRPAKVDVDQATKYPK